MDVTQPGRQFRDPGIDGMWAAIQANQKEIADAKLATAQSLGVMSAQLATMQATVSNIVKLLENKQDREEDQTYRAWQQERYNLVSPQQRQADKYAMNVSIQTVCILLALVFSALAAFGVHL